jgi:hypothetical protein
MSPSVLLLVSKQHITLLYLAFPLHNLYYSLSPRPQAHDSASAPSTLLGSSGFNDILLFICLFLLVLTPDNVTLEKQK